MLTLWGGSMTKNSIKLKQFITEKHTAILKQIYDNDEKILKINYKDYVELIENIIDICKTRGRF